MKAKRFFFICILCSVFCVLYSVFCFAATPRDEYKKIQKEIRKQKEKLEEVKKLESSFLSEIEVTNKQLRDAERAFRKNKERLANTEAKIAGVEADISHNKGNIEKHREWIKRKLRIIHKYGRHSDMVVLLLSVQDVSQLMRSGKYLQFITRYEHGMLGSYKGALENLNEKEQQLVSLRKDLIRNKERVKAEEQTLMEKKEKKETLLASAKREKSSRRRMLKEMEEASKNILEIIKKSERAGKDKETGTFGKGFSGLKGKLPWPVEGKVAIPYGSQRDPQFNTPIFRSGAFIQSSSESYAKTVYNGRVVFAEWFKGYGQLVIVNHGNGYHTLYGSLSEIFAKVGDIIKGKQIVGRVGNSGIVNSPGLYFEVRYKGKPLDPIQWLQRR